MKNPFSLAWYHSGTYSPEVMELAHGLPLQEREEIDEREDSHSVGSSEATVSSEAADVTDEITMQDIITSVEAASSTAEVPDEITIQDSASSATDIGSDTTESTSEVPAHNTTTSEAGAPDRQARKKSAWYRFFSKLLCLGSGGNDQDSEIYHPTQKVDEPNTSSRDQEAVQQDTEEITPLETTEGLPADPVNGTTADAEHSRSASAIPKKRSLLYRFFARLLCLGSREENEPEVVSEHGSSDIFQHILNPQDPPAATYVPFEKYDKDTSFIRGESDTSPASEPGTSSESLHEQTIDVHVEESNTSSVEEPGTSSRLLSELDPGAKNDNTVSQQPITQLKKQRPVSYYHITNTQAPSSSEGNLNDRASCSQLSKNFKTHSIPGISALCGSETLDTQGRLQQESASLPDLCSEYLPSGGIIDCAYNVPTNSASLQKVDNIPNLSAVGRTPSSSKRSKMDMQRPSHSSLLTIHEEHEQPFSSDTFSDIRNTMRKINRSRFSEAYQSVLSEEYVPFAARISCSPQATRSDSSISKIIKLFEEKSKTASQNLPKDLPSTMHR